MLLKRNEEHLTGTEIAAIMGEWSLRTTSGARGNWRQFKLVATTTRSMPKRCYWLGWNGKRMAKSHDAGLLAQYQPTIYAWVVEKLARAYPHGAKS